MESPTVVASAAERLYRRRLIPTLRAPAAAVIGGGVIALLVLVAAIAPLIAPHSPDAIDLGASFSGMGAAHPLGADSSGRDILSRIIYGTRLSLLGPLLVVLLSSTVGTSLGLIAGYTGGVVDGVMARIWDVMFAFPPLLLAIVIVAMFGAGFWTATLAIAIVYMPLMARVVRGLVLVEREKAYVDACRVQGFNAFRITLGHVLPNIAPTVVAQATLNFGYSLLDLAGLAFLGLGVQPPTADWGAMLAEGRQFILFSPNEVVVASIAIAIAVVAFNLLGDALTHRVRGWR
jgi:peptide/nickel transport system permease protein